MTAIKFDLDLLGMTCLAAVWGVTNTYIANATRQDKAESKEVDQVERAHFLLKSFYYLVRLVRNWRFTLPFLINQSASVVFLSYVIKTDLSKAVCTINSLTLIFTVLSGSLIFKEPIDGFRISVGSLFIVSGLYLMSNY